MRVERARKQLKEAASNGDANAVEKVKKTKKADVLRSAKYR